MAGADTDATSLPDLLRRRDIARTDLAWFLALTTAARALARWRRLRGRGRDWSSDATSRTGRAGTVG